jgi:putative SOS response-associated peptidase YedK
MSDKYQNRTALDDITRLFLAQPCGPALVDVEVEPAGRGLVVREQDRARIVSAMRWGFPLHPGKAALARYPKAKLKPVHKAKGLTRHFWKAFAADPAHRCLIPVERFVERPAAKDKEAPVWFSLPDQPVFAWAGLWRDSPEWGEVYSCVMTEAAGPIVTIHDRMPVILKPRDWDRWLHGSLQDVLDLQRPYDGDIASSQDAATG